MIIENKELVKSTLELLAEGIDDKFSFDSCKEENYILMIRSFLIVADRDILSKLAWTASEDQLKVILIALQINVIELMKLGNIRKRTNYRGYEVVMQEVSLSKELISLFKTVLKFKSKQSSRSKKVKTTTEVTLPEVLENDGSPDKV